MYADIARSLTDIVVELVFRGFRESVAWTPPRYWIAEVRLVTTSDLRFGSHDQVLCSEIVARLNLRLFDRYCYAEHVLNVLMGVLRIGNLSRSLVSSYT